MGSFFMDCLSEVWVIVLFFSMMLWGFKHARKPKYTPKHIFDRGTKGDWDNCNNIGF